MKQINITNLSRKKYLNDNISKYNKKCKKYENNMINNTKTSKNTKKNTNFSRIFQLLTTQIKKDFVDWIVGIQEDEPIKFEAKYVYFIVDFSQNDIALSYSADERLLKTFDYGDYFPLEAEYLFSTALKTLAVKLFTKKSISKLVVLDMLKNICLSSSNCIDFLSDKMIFFGERFKNVIV